MYRLVLLVWIIMLSVVYANVHDSTFYVTDGCDLTYGDVIDTRRSVSSMIECSWYCSRNDQCLSVKYDRINTTCQLNSKQHGSLSTSCSAMLTYATIQKNTNTVRKMIDVFCNESSECLVNNSQCIMNNCQCDPGYSYQQHDKESCVTSCDVYGPTFTVYSGYRLYGFNNRMIPIDNADACKRACTNEEDFVCRSANYLTSLRRCHMSIETAVTKPNSYQRISGFDYNQRNCL